MRIVFCGTAAFAVPSLLAVAAEHEVVAAVTQPDRSGSRGRPAPRPLGDAAERLGFPVLRPPRLPDAEAVRELLDLAPDALVVAAYGQIIPAALLDGTRLGGINVHGSLLPRWRGAAPVAAAILHGDDRSGVSIMRMDTGLDTGPVLATRSVPLHGDETTPGLSERLAELGAGLLVDVLGALAGPGLAAHPQDSSLATSAPRLRREDGMLDWERLDAAAIDRHVRALQPWPGVTLPLAGARVAVLEGRPVSDRGHLGTLPGTVIAAHGEAVDIAAAGGVYSVVSVQPPGRRVMSAAAFLRGHRPAHKVAT